VIGAESVSFSTLAVLALPREMRFQDNYQLPSVSFSNSAYPSKHQVKDRGPDWINMSQGERVVAAV
jgi:hypothetical protein